jgi:hypothetical protein
LVAQLLIVERLHHQLRTGLAVNGIEVHTIRSATLSIALEVSERHEQKDSSVMWFGKHDAFTGCQMEIRGCIRTTSADYESTHRAYREWPL